jgi:hypothetical protein
MSDFITTETDVAAFLMSKEHELLDIRVVDDQCVFVFRPDAAPLADAYRRGAHVVAQTFARQRYALLGLIAEAKAKAKRPSSRTSKTSYTRTPWHTDRRRHPASVEWLPAHRRLFVWRGV